MSQLDALYPLAIEHTKNKVLEDIDRYIGSKEKLASFETYLQDRKHYLEQIWINVWLNKVTNDISRMEKKTFLSGKGFEVEGVDRKLINHLFRTEMRSFKPFDCLNWVTRTFQNNESQWVERYDAAREEFLKHQEEAEREERKRKVFAEIDTELENIMDEQYQVFYLHLRHFVAILLHSQFQNNTKYKKVDTFALEIPLQKRGVFLPEDYSTFVTFLDELTGEIHKTRHRGRTFFEYETYGDLYQNVVSEYIRNLIPEMVLDQLNESIKNKYKEAFAKPLNTKTIRHLLVEDLVEIIENFFDDVQEEYVSDLLSIANIPFDPSVHEEIFRNDLAMREKKKELELAELERKKEEEARMLEDIFGTEYRPSLGRNINYYLHIGETNTGKTHHALQRMKNSSSGLYLAPLRLLALEVYDKLNAEGVPCTLKTGEEEKVVTSANHFSCTVEMFHEKDFYEVIVIDEAQMIADKDRGFSWYKAITKANAREVHIVGSRNLKEMVIGLLGDANVVEIIEYQRKIPLQVESQVFNFSGTKRGDALVCFSRRRVLETASRLQNSGFTVSMIYGSMPPETRKKEMLRFIKGETKVIVSTDAIGMGLNLPIRRIVFLENEKFDGTRRRRLTSQEIKQIAGRAGRKGLYDVGKVAFMKDIKIMQQLLFGKDEPVHTFAIAPTNGVFERFQKYSHDLGFFFELWKKFDSPIGTEKATLHEERELYEMIRGTEIEARLSMMDLYGFLHLPFSTKDAGLTDQWRETMYAIVNGQELPEPIIKKRNLEDVELSYKAIGLHLLFLYRLDKRLEAVYWERVREELSDSVHEFLKTEVKKMKKTCRNCGKHLPWDHPYSICDRCHFEQYRRW